MTRTKKPFEPLEAGKVKIYLCGPTVYDLLHIGNFRGAIFFNLLRNWMIKLGHDVTFVYNYTDVDDKIIKKANELGVESREISEKYIAEFEKDFNRLELRPHDHNPKVTDYMPQIIKFVDDLVKKEKAYEIEGEVFYRIDSFENYGKLSGKKLDELEAGQRVEVDKKKENPFDFVLWKPSKKDEPSWDSPWGRGRPGWHIECSAMIREILGDTIDIHGGGVDLIFPHHENEIAQGEGVSGQNYCRCWVHNNFINIKDQKMSKSLGNVVRGREFMDKYHPEVLKYLMLSSHYRSLLSLSEDKIMQTVQGLSRVYSALEQAYEVRDFGPLEGGKVYEKFQKVLNSAGKKIEKALNDDFNTQEVMASIFDVIREFNSQNFFKKRKDVHGRASVQGFIDWIVDKGEMMALFQQDPSQILEELNQILVKEKDIDVKKVEDLLQKRDEARQQKDWSRADEVRDELKAMGIEFQDGQGKTTWRVSLKAAEPNES
jgi:cysteinyl-tRNA synthetase